MEKLAGCCLSVLLLLAVPSSVLAQEYFGQGGTLQLRPTAVSEEITSILWKHNANLVAEWVKEKLPLTYYSGFKNRTTLNTTSGSLEIRNMSPADSGVYSVEINNNVQPARHNAKLIEAVTQPVVDLKPLTCAAASDTCTLHCEGTTAEAEPVTYSWKIGGGGWTDGGEKKGISNDEATQGVKEFKCRMKNPISEEESEPKLNPFFQEKGPGGVSGVAAGVIVFIVILAVFAGVAFWKRENVKEMLCITKEDEDNPARKEEGHPLASDGESAKNQNDMPSASAPSVNGSPAEPSAGQSVTKTDETS